MDSLTLALQALLEATDRQLVTVGKLRLTWYANGVLNIDRHEGDLRAADVNAVRAAFDSLKYDEIEAWLPTQGASWVSNGVSAGVSFRVRKREAAS